MEHSVVLVVAHQPILQLDCASLNEMEILLYLDKLHDMLHMYSVSSLFFCEDRYFCISIDFSPAAKSLHRLSI